MNQQAAAIIKTVPNNITNPYSSGDPYNDNEGDYPSHSYPSYPPHEPLSKSTKNMNQPMSQQISRVHSR